jgi:nitroimidazol reductase NimA-like FMN-containing flavoprotein (pyridoxamine 5'-phosphate oxidase superfamily)
MSDTPGMSQSEIEEFFRNSKTLLRLGTIDEKGGPMIHPVWYYYDDERLYILTSKNSRKAKNMERRRKVYFSVDTEIEPYKGVKGKATTSLVKDSAKVQTITERMITKYMGSLDNPGAKYMMDGVKSGSEEVVEIAPAYYSVWDYGKSF